jgi:thioredoxin-like negative regulator of GroEL
MTIDNSNQLNNARKAISKGDKKTAQQILAGIINEDSNNVDAWLMLAEILDDPEHRIESLKRVLAINPNNVIAARRLSELTQVSYKQSNKDQVSPSNPL